MSRPFKENSKTGLTRYATDKAIKDATEARRIDAITTEHTLKSSDAWKKQEKLWEKASETQRKSWLYAMVMFDGVCAETKRGIKLITKYFSISVKELEPYKDVLDMADAARVLKINRNQLGTSLGRDDQPNFKFFMGKQFGYQVNDPAHDGVESVDEGKDITINVMTKPEQQEDESAADKPDESPAAAKQLH